MINLSELNSRQRKACEAIYGPVLILAGAGSGKTRTVTYRIAHMIVNMKIPASEILAVSFTNKASQEMNERVTKLIGSRRKRGITLSTFHSLGIKILRQEIHHLGYNKDFTIYDSSDQLSIIREGLKNFKMDKASFDKKTILSKIGLLKNNSINFDEFADSEFFDEENAYDVATEHVYRFYQDKLNFCNALDFDDILFLCVKLFKEFPEVAKKYSQIYKYIMIDEYQDTNELQFEMVRALTSCHDNLCVVGDDDQSIYAFRGADITNILNFEKLYKNTKVIKLEQNYRSTNHILKLANNVIINNTKRKDKTMFSDNNEGSLPQIWACGNSDHEAQVVIDELVKYQLDGKFLGEVALLYRSNTQVPPFEDQLRLAGIPYTIIGGQKFYEKKEIKDLIAYLSVIHNPKDELSLRRILNIPQRSIGTKSLKDFLETAHNKKTTLFNILKEISKEENKRAQNIREFIDLINKYKYLFTTMDLHHALTGLINDLNYMDFVEKSYDSPKISARKKDDVRNFILSAEKFKDRFKEEATLSFWLERLLLADNQDKQNNNNDELAKNEVQLMTYHSSKGLEFDTVFMIGCEEELLPHKNTIKEGSDIDEERRLCYVGITRARKRLIMTYAQERKIYGKNLKRSKSRFLLEIPETSIPEYDRTNFGHLSEDEVEKYKSNFFNDLLSSLDD